MKQFLKQASKRLFFLVGILVGVILQLPYIHWLEKTPQIIADPISDKFYQQKDTHIYNFHLVPSIFRLGTKTNLRIVVTSYEKLNNEARRRYGEDIELVGFYDPLTNELWCVDSTNVLLHELRHVFEGPFHR